MSQTIHIFPIWRLTKPDALFKWWCNHRLNKGRLLIPSPVYCCPGKGLAVAYRILHSPSSTLQRPCTENAKQIFPEMKLRGLVPNSTIHIQVSVRYLYIPTIGLPILLFCGNWERAVQFPFWDYINRIFFAVYLGQLLFSRRLNCMYVHHSKRYI